jgi:MoxR-like ATPase
MLKERIGEALSGTRTLAEAADRLDAEGNVFFSERFLLPRPVLQAVLSDVPVLLLVDEVDKADPEFEAFLLEVLADHAVTIPELGTMRARHPPRMVLTSNATRELSDALRRRCLHLFIDFPTQERELAIVRSRVPGVPEELARQTVAAVAVLRGMDLKKAPSISETLDWIRSLVLLQAHVLDGKIVSETLNVLLKHEADLAAARPRVDEIARGIAPGRR